MSVLDSIADMSSKYAYDRLSLQLIIENIPANVFFKDTECRYQIASHVCQMLNSGGNPDFTIYGKTDKEIQPDKELGEKFYNEDLQVLENREPITYIQPMVFGDLTFYYQISKKAVVHPDGTLIGIVGLISDMTELISLQKKMEYYSTHDALTGIYNREYLKLQEQNFSEKYKFPVAVILGDSDNLKKVNDTYGHAKGDLLIKSTVENIQSVIPNDSDIYRIGGDEYLIIIPECDEEKCFSYINDIGAIEDTLCIENVPVKTSFGYHIMNENEVLKEAMDIADAMMYEVKRNHKSK